MADILDHVKSNGGVMPNTWFVDRPTLDSIRREMAAEALRQAVALLDGVEPVVFCGMRLMIGTPPNVGRALEEAGARPPQGDSGPNSSTVGRPR